MSKNGVNTKINIAVIQEQLAHITEDVTEIKNNHLPHLHERLDSIELKMAYYVGGMAAVGFILQVILSLVK